MGIRAPWRGESQGFYKYQVLVKKDHGGTKRDSVVAANEVCWKNESLKDKLMPARTG